MTPLEHAKAALRAFVDWADDPNDTKPPVWHAREALRALDAEGADGWRPIETAPRDGTRFDAWVPDAFGGRRMTGLSFDWRGKLRKHGLLTPAELPRWPTHWRPLSPPPAALADKKTI